jgi:hypothetical protein
LNDDILGQRELRATDLDLAAALGPVVGH